MAKSHEEWLKQADYDMETAEVMFDAGRYLYAVFMCHLSLEKALKGLYQQKLDKFPPKTHNLIFLLSNARVSPPESIRLTLASLNAAGVMTRYPDDLETLKAHYTKQAAQNILNETREAHRWIRTTF